MSWTYTDAPATVPRDAVRLELGDTSATDPLPITDAAVAYYLSEENDVVLMAAARAADSLAAYYARQTDYSMGSLSQSASQRREHFKTLAAQLRMKARTSQGAELFAGGLTISGKQTLDTDTAAIQPSFRVGIDDFPGNGNTAGDDTENEG